MEERLLAIWMDVSQLDNIDRDMTVFELGLDSIKVIDISEQIYKEMKIRLEWEEFNVISTFNDTLSLLNEKKALLENA
ncbi:phosphopantetheine-binding protein [Vibrio sp. AND4]|uniref:acyl carrier protein n=1 Tax=Vibrio sp. AND4 TaxID=314289 RepID=UPI00015F2DED|nr:phosphopantetheine-binding protein [Vibrio sp. AND4]EDP58803.1 phosphopantetheine attachment site domain protein [Vibrio sp. AND4]